MRYYPINLDIRNRRCLVVGGGSVGTRKVITLTECGAAVTVVSPQITPELRQLADQKAVAVKRRHYQTSDMNGMFLVIGATDNKELNWQIYSDAERIGKLCNIADRPEACNFILPSIVSRGDLIIAISTSGKSPAFAKTLRKELEIRFGEEYADFLQVMGEIRKKLLMKNHAPEEHKPVFEKLIKKGLLEMIREKKKEEINRLLSDVLGKAYDFDSLLKNRD